VDLICSAEHPASAMATSGGAGSIIGFTGTTPIYGSGVAGSTSGTGTALLSAEDESRLRCSFVFGSSNVGYGTCEDDKKNIYDLQIH
jgi:hypothetical protein